MAKHKITFDRTLDDGTDVVVVASARTVTPYTAEDLRVKIYAKDGSDIKNFSSDEVNSIEEEAIEKFNELEEIEF